MRNTSARIATANERSHGHALFIHYRYLARTHEICVRESSLNRERREIKLNKIIIEVYLGRFVFEISLF